MKKLYMLAIIVSSMLGISSSLGQSVTNSSLTAASNRLTIPEVELSNKPDIYAPSTLGPGDSIGISWYDFQTNGSPNHTIINYGNGQVSIARMGAASKGWADRGTYFTHRSSATSPFTPLKLIETVRAGWGNIAQFSSAGGIEVVVSHTTLSLSGLRINVDAAKGAGYWTESVLSGINGRMYPKIATGISTLLHIISSASSNPDTLYYHRSNDVGATFAFSDRPILVGDTIVGADEYDIACSGSKVAIVLGAYGRDVYLALSTDNGNNFTQSIIYDVKTDSNSIAPNESQEQPDGSISVEFDRMDNVHIVWGSRLAKRRSDNWPQRIFSVNAGLWHYSAATGAHPILYPLDRDTMLLKGNRNMPGVDGGLVTMPSIGFDASNRMYVVYLGQSKELSVDTLPYVHVYATYSDDGGNHWYGPTDLTPVTGSDNTFPFLAKNVDSNLHIVYNTDKWPGNYLVGDTQHPDTFTVIKYLKFPVANLSKTPIVNLVEERSYSPDRFLLEQNYPNPFNPSTTISYGLPSRARVKLTICDLLGRMIETLVDEEQTAGWKVVKWNADRFASGIYFYIIQADQFNAVRKLVLIR